MMFEEFSNSEKLTPQQEKIAFLLDTATDDILIDFFLRLAPNYQDVKNTISILKKVINKNSNDRVRAQAMYALKLIGTETAAKVLAEHLPYEGEEDWRGLICQYLGEMGFPSTIPALLKVLENEWDLEYGDLIIQTAKNSLAKLGFKR